MDNSTCANRRSILRLSTAFALSTLVSTARTASRPPSHGLKGGPFAIEVDDLKVFGEVRGSGPLLIVQNGMWFKTYTDDFASDLLRGFAPSFTVLTFDPRGQGRTNLGKGRISYGRFAADTVRLMDKLHIESAHFFGHSDGGCIELSLLIDFPDRIKSATLSGTPYSHEAYSEHYQAVFTSWYEAMLRNAPLDEDSTGFFEAYRKVSPEPQRLMEARLQQRACWSTEPNFSRRELETIGRPVLVVDAGKDLSIPSAQFKILADSIPGAERLELPEMAHDVRPFVPQLAKAIADFTRKHDS